MNEITFEIDNFTVMVASDKPKYIYIYYSDKPKRGFELPWNNTNRFHYTDSYAIVNGPASDPINNKIVNGAKISNNIDKIKNLPLSVFPKDLIDCAIFVIESKMLDKVIIFQ